MLHQLLQLIKLTLVLAGLFLLTACGGQKALKKVEFQPAMPEAIDRPATANGSIYNISNNRFLFEDLKARRVGDLITVILDESTNAAKTASTNTSKDAEVEIPGATLLGLPVTHNGRAITNNSLTSNSSFAGAGDSSQSNSLSGNITVTISQVLSNGNMLIKGEKLLTLNNGSEVVRISGIVRPSDIAPDNTIVSTQIANANITYSGNGAVADSNRQGWVTRFFNSPFWPF